MPDRGGSDDATAGSRSGIDLFSIAGIRITIDYSWFIIFLLVAWSLTSFFRQRLPADASGIAVWSWSLVASILLFVSVLLHELSHSFVALAKGMSVPRITLFIFGGVSHLGHEPERPVDEFQIAIAGPLLSFALAGFCALAWVQSGSLGMPGVTGILTYLTAVNAAVAVFNLVPAFPLDGGRVLRALIWSRRGSLTRATIIASRTGRALAIALMGFGVLAVFGGGNPFGLWYVLIGLFLLQAAHASAERARIRQALTGTPVRRIMTPSAVTLSAADSLAGAVEHAFLQHHFVSYPVLQDGRVEGILSLRDVRRFPRQEWSGRTVREAMVRLDESDMARPADDVVEVLERMLRTGRGRLPVVEGGRLAGMVTRRDIMDFLRVQTDLADGD